MPEEGIGKYSEQEEKKIHLWMLENYSFSTPEEKNLQELSARNAKYMTISHAYDYCCQGHRHPSFCHQTVSQILFFFLYDAVSYFKLAFIGAQLLYNAVMPSMVG